MTSLLDVMTVVLDFHRSVRYLITQLVRFMTTLVIFKIALLEFTPLFRKTPLTRCHGGSREPYSLMCTFLIVSPIKINILSPPLKPVSLVRYFWAESFWTESLHFLIVLNFAQK